MVVSLIREHRTVVAVRERERERERESLLLIDAENCHFDLITKIKNEYHNIE